MLIAILGNPVPPPITDTNVYYVDENGAFLVDENEVFLIEKEN